MSLVKFYRGGAGDSLPQYQEGAIFIVERSDNKGDMYVDVANQQRLHIIPDSPIKVVSKQWYDNNQNTQSEADVTYIIKDYSATTVETVTKPVPAFMIGDGQAYIGDLLVINSLTQDLVARWNAVATTVEENSSNWNNAVASIATLETKADDWDSAVATLAAKASIWDSKVTVSNTPVATKNSIEAEPKNERIEFSNSFNQQ